MRTRYAARILFVLGVLCLGQASWIHAKALVAQVLRRRAWAETQRGAQTARPWPWADTWPVARLRSEQHGVDLIVLEGATGEATAFAPGRVVGTARPGHDGNVGIVGHRDTHFAFLEGIAPGDVMRLTAPDAAERRYEVVAVRVVHESDTSALEPTESSMLTLVTCYPFRAAVPGGPLRLVVRAEAR